MVGGGAQIPCPGYFQTHPRRVISLCHLHTLKESQRYKAQAGELQLHN